MNYKGKLYGKVGETYFDTGNTSDDWDSMVGKIIQQEKQIRDRSQIIKLYPGLDDHDKRKHMTYDFHALQSKQPIKILSKNRLITFLDRLLSGHNDHSERPKIVCLCGSTRFGSAFQQANLNETLKGNIVLSIGCNMKSDDEIFGNIPESKLVEIKEKLDELHKRKIDLADEVFILNVGGYIGSSTKSEWDYAIEHGKKVRFLELLDF